MSSTVRNKEIIRLMAGFRRFREKYYSTDSKLFAKLAIAQTPKTLVIGCSDSRVDPAILTSAAPGELFVIRNVANLVPPFELSDGFHGVSSAIEFAVVNLRVENILIFGHRQCGGIRALMSAEATSTSKFIGPWMSIAKKAKEKVLLNFANHPDANDFDQLCRSCEMESIVVSLENLKTFPFIAEAMSENRLQLHGAFFDIEKGQISEFDHETATFRSLEI